jgi:hypothetical protein
LARTPPAAYVPPPGESTIDSKSVSTRLYPNVDEFAILSEIEAKRWELVCKPATPAFSEEEIDMGTPFCCGNPMFHHQIDVPA